MFMSIPQLQLPNNIMGQLLMIALILMTVRGQFTNPGCTNFTIDNECVECADRYYLQLDICYPVSPLCLTYSNITGACLSCFSGYEINGTACVRTLTANCLTHNANGICTECENRFYLVGQNCVPVDISCTTYLSTGECTGCITSHYLFAGRCYSLIDNCLIQTADICQQCDANYILGNNLCHPEIDHCLGYDQGVCTVCQNDMMLVGQGISMACLPPIDNCTVYNLTSGQCLVCQQYFRMVQGECAIMLDPFCRTFNSSTCIECSTRYYFNADNRCESVDQLCKTYNVSTGSCLSCYNGYQLNNTRCIKALEKMDPYCSEFNGTTCMKCSWGYRFDQSGKCIELDYLCWKYDQVSYECEECYPGFMVGNTSRCELITEAGCLTWFNGSCQSCHQGYYLFNMKCQQIDPLCANFDHNTKKCKNCYQGYHLVNETCEIIPENSSISSCKTVDSQGECSSCYWGSYLKNGECHEVDPLCRTFDQITGQCTSCYGGYFLLRRSGQCYPLA